MKCITYKLRYVHHYIVELLQQYVLFRTLGIINFHFLQSLILILQILQLQILPLLYYIHYQGWMVKMHDSAALCHLDFCSRFSMKNVDIFKNYLCVGQKPFSSSLHLALMKSQKGNHQMQAIK